MKTEDLIKKLSNDLEPVTTLRPSWQRAGTWAIITLLFILGTAPFHGGLRFDIDATIHQPAFLIETLAMFFAGICAVLAALQLSIPDTAFKKVTAYLIAISSAIWSLLILINFAQSDSLKLSEHLNSPELIGHCVADLITFASIPALLAYLLLKHGAPSRHKWAGLSVALASLSIAALGTRYVCALDEPTHLFSAHFMPVLIFACIGMFFGRVLFNWK